MADDSEVWEYAGLHGFAIVSKDHDFRTRSLVDGHPPKVVWIGRGNCSTDEAESILRDFHRLLRGFDDDPALSFLAIA